MGYFYKINLKTNQLEYIPIEEFNKLNKKSSKNQD